MKYNRRTLKQLTEYFWYGRNLDPNFHSVVYEDNSARVEYSAGNSRRRRTEVVEYSEVDRVQKLMNS